MWLILALTCAFLSATVDSISKIILKQGDEYLVGWLRLLASLPFLLSILLWVPIPKLDIIFIHTMLVLLPLEIIAYILYIKAIKYSPLSLALPFLALTPLFLIISGKFILKESVGPFGIGGISLVVLGAYMLNIETLHLGVFEPIRSLYKQKGSVYMIIAALIYSVTAALGKLAINHSSALFFSAIYDPIVAFFLTPVIIVRYKAGWPDFQAVKKYKWFFLLLGVIGSLAVVTHTSAISIAKAAYMIAVKRLSIVFGVLYGWVLFKERHIINRLVGALLMILGVLLISMS